MRMEKTTLSFSTVSTRIREIEYPEVDLVIGIAKGGIVPASLVAFHLGLAMEIIQLNYRDEENIPRFDSPEILKNLETSVSGMRILLVDDVCVSGKTLEFARELLDDCVVHTFVMKGNAEISVFPEISNCVNWPWNDFAEKH